MRKLKHRAIERNIHQTITELDWWLQPDPNDPQHRTHAELVTLTANDHLDEALHARTYDTDHRGGHTPTGPERDSERLAHHPDPIATRITQLAGLLTLQLDTARTIRTLAGALTTSHTERDRAAASAIAAASRSPGAGHCNNCTTWVPGTRTDRLKAGRCPTCFEYQRTHHGNERPRSTWDSGTATTATNPRQP